MKKWGRILALIQCISLLFTIVSSPVLATENSSSQLVYYRRILRIHNQGSESAQNLTVTMLLLPKVAVDNQVVFEEKLTPEAYEVIEDEFGNRTAKINIETLAKGQSIDIILETNLSNSAWFTDKSKLWSLSQTIAQQPEGSQSITYDVQTEWKRYLEDELYVSVSHPSIQELSVALTKDAQGPYEKAQKIFDYVNTNMSYDDNPAFARKGSVSALYNLKGICTEFASLMVALLRASGIPSRLVGGYLLGDESLNQEKTQVYGLDMAHAWVEFYITGFGWLPADPTHIFYLNDIRVPARQAFAALPTWGHIASSYGMEHPIYTLEGDVIHSQHVTTSSVDQFTLGHRKMNDEIDVFINQNQRVLFKDAKPIIADNNRTFVPLRDIFQSLGATVIWNELDQSIIAYRKGSTILLRVGQAKIWINQKEYTIDSVAYIDTETSRTMIPLRAVGEAFGAYVEWQATQKQIFLWID